MDINNIKNDKDLVENHKIKHNPTNQSDYLNFLRQQRTNFKNQAMNVKNDRIKDNLQVWLDSLEFPWNQADLSFFAGKTLQDVNSLLQTNKITSFSITSPPGYGKTFLLYAIIKEYLKRGLLTPSEIEFTTIRDAYVNINGMFQSREWKDRFFNPRAKLYVIEGCSLDFTYLKMKGQLEFWGEFLAMIREYNKHFIVTYTMNPSEIQSGGKFVPKLHPDNKPNFDIVRQTNRIMLTANSRNLNKHLRKHY